jgi:hypothetical protein
MLNYQRVPWNIFLHLGELCGKKGLYRIPGPQWFSDWGPGKSTSHPISIYGVMSDLTTMITLNGKQSQKTIENYHLFGYINYFDWAMASIATVSLCRFGCWGSQKTWRLSINSWRCADVHQQLGFSRSNGDTVHDKTHIRPYFAGIFHDIPLHSHYIFLVYGRYLQYRFLTWPLILWMAANSCTSWKRR